MLHGTGLIEGGLPPWVRGVALVGIGALIGARFARMQIKTLLSHVNAALGSFAVAIVISAIFVAVIVLTTHVRFADVIVAFAPGAMDAMLALALTLHIDPIFVGAHHLSRFVFVTHHHARHRPSVRTAAGRRGRLGSIDLSTRRPGREIQISKSHSPLVVARFAAFAKASARAKQKAVIPRACGVSSTPRLLVSSTAVSGILDAPHSRGMTTGL